MAEITYYSKEGYEKLKKELNQLKTKERSEIAKQIAEARDKGDLSENAEYDAAKEAQGHLEAKIAKLENVMAYARIVDEKEIDTSKAYILSTVEILNHKTRKKQKYTLVSENEADHKQGKISVKSPIGKAIIGKKKGEVVEAQVPAGLIKLEILNISR